MEHLGAIPSAYGIYEEKIEHRAGAAARDIGAMRTAVLKRRKLKNVTKMRLYNAKVIPAFYTTVRHGQ